MAVWNIDGETPHADIRDQRIAAGTVGGEHAVPASFAGKTLTSVIDDSDTRILYGTTTGHSVDFSIDGSDLSTQSHTQTIIGGRQTNGTPGAAAQLLFRGTSIGVLGGVNPYSGTMQIFIDGEPTAGRVPTFMSLYVGNAAVNEPVVAVDDTTVVGFSTNSGLADAGTIILGSELIDYTSIDIDGDGNSVFTGCTRGAHGTIAVNHFASETIFAWTDTIILSTDAADGGQGGYATKQLLYYNPFLEPGNHKITIIVSRATNGYARIYFDGFITGSLVGSESIFTQMGTATIQTACDANGHGIIGDLFFTASNVTIMGVLGYTQVGTEDSNGTTMAKLGVTRSPFYTDGETRPFFYLHNGPANTNVTIVITFTYIGETL